MIYDSIIIGFGKGGKTLAGLLAQKGEKVAVVEKSKEMYGGTCINVGCLPSKSLVKNSSIAASHSKEHNEGFYSKAISEKFNLVTMLRGKNYAKLDGFENIDIIDGFASFIDSSHIKVETIDEVLELEAKKIFINTGSTPIIPNIDGIDDNPNVLISQSLMDTENLPENLTIIGAGYIGLEFASIYAGFGSKVRVLDRNDVFLSREDTDIAQEIHGILSNRGIDIISSANVTRVENDTLFYTVDGVENSITNTKILLATGRKPNIEGLGLEKAGVEVNDRGLVIVDDHLRTTANNIWAMGDVSSALQFTYISLDDYRIVASDLFEDGKYSLKDRKNVPYSVFLSTPYSRVGLNESEAKTQGYNFRVLKMPTAMVPKAHVLGKTAGLLKALVDVDTNKILGAMLLCEESYEVINIIRLAMQMDADYTVLKNGIYTHPTMSEALNDLFSL